MTEPQAAPSADPQRPDNRRVKVLLQPFLQIKLGLYSMILSFAFAVALLGILHAQWVRFRSWLSLTEIKYLVDSEVARYAQDSLFWVIITLAIFLITNTLISILLTHRLVGPTYAFRRHLRALIDGNYAARTRLREHDAFTEVADDLNALAQVLEERARAASLAASEPEPEPKAEAAPEPKAEPGSETQAEPGATEPDPEC